MPLTFESCYDQLTDRMRGITSDGSEQKPWTNSSRLREIKILTAAYTQLNLLKNSKAHQFPST